MRVSSRFHRLCFRWKLDRWDCWWWTGRSEQKLCRPDRHPTRNDAEYFCSCAMKDFTFDEVAAKTVPKVPWPMNFFRRIVSNGMRKPSEERSEKIFKRKKLFLSLRKDSCTTTDQIGCNGMYRDFAVFLTFDFFLFLHAHHQRFEPKGVTNRSFQYIRFSQTAMAWNQAIDQIIAFGILHEPSTHLGIPVVQETIEMAHENVQKRGHRSFLHEQFDE